MAVMLVAYMTSSFPTSQRLCYGRASVNLFSKPFTLHQLCAGPGWAPESGPGHVGCGLPLSLPGASSYLSPGRGLREALPGLGSHPSLFLPLSSSHSLTTTPPPRRAGGGLTHPLLGSSSRGAGAEKEDHRPEGLVSARGAGHGASCPRGSGG